MKKIFLILTIMLSFAFVPTIQAQEFENVQLELRDYSQIEIPTGTFIPVMTMQEISTATCNEGYKVKFLTTSDLFIRETKVIPKDTVVYGYIEEIHDPVVGTNASMKIKLTKMIYADGCEVPMKGYIYTSNNNLIGGGISEPVKWIKVPHYQSRFRYMNLRMKPSMERKMGIHSTIQAGSAQIVVLTAPMYVSHTLIY